MGVPKHTVGATSKAVRSGGGLVRFLRWILVLLIVAAMLGGSWLLHTEQTGPFMQGVMDTYADFSGDGKAGR